MQGTVTRSPLTNPGSVGGSHVQPSGQLCSTSHQAPSSPTATHSYTQPSSGEPLGDGLGLGQTHSTRTVSPHSLPGIVGGSAHSHPGGQ